MLALRTATLRLGARRAALPASGVSARGLAAKADHSPPLKLFGIPARYANATYVAASKAGMLPQVETELLGFQALMKKNSTIKDYLTSPTVQRSEQVATIEKLFSGPKKSSFVTKNLLTVMAANARLDEVDKVVDAFSSQMKASRKEVPVEIISAEPLTKAQESAIVGSLKTLLDGGKAVLATSVDPSIMGGLTVKIGDKFLDLSVKSKIDTVKRSLSTA